MEAASQGARVMHLRAVELGRNEGVPIRVLHSQRHGPGTLICHPTIPMETQRAVTTIALKTDIGRVTLASMPNRPGIQRAIFDPIAKAGISVDDIIQTEVHTAATDGDRCSLVFTVDRTELAEVQPLVDKVVAEHGGTATVDLGLSKVSAVGVGMQSQPGVAARMFSALADAGIRVANITTSEIKISCIIDEADGKPALKTIHDAFGLAHAEVRTTGAQAAAV
jgi:aspartate kinase